MTYVKVTIVSLVLRATTLSLTLPAGPAAGRPAHHTSPTTTDIPGMKFSGSQVDVRDKDDFSLFHKVGMKENNESRKVWRVAGVTSRAGVLLPGDARPKVGQDTVSQMGKTRVEPPLPHLAMTHLPALTTASKNTLEFVPSLPSGSSWVPSVSPPTAAYRHQAAAAPRLPSPARSGSSKGHTPPPPVPAPTPGPLTHASTARTWAAAGTAAGTRETAPGCSGCGEVQAPREGRRTTSQAEEDVNTSGLASKVNDLEFFGSWEAVLLVCLPAAWLALTASLCCLTRSALGQKLLEKLCPTPTPEEVESGHGIGFMDGSPGMRRRMTQSGETLAVLATALEGQGRGPTAEDQQQQQQQQTTTGGCVGDGMDGCMGEEDMGELEGQEDAGEGSTSADDSWCLEEGGGKALAAGALEESQRVLRRLSLIQEEVAP